MGALLAVMLVIAACGDDDGGSGGEGNEALVQSLRTKIVDAQSADGSSPIGDDEAECVAGALIRRSGDVERAAGHARGKLQVRGAVGGHLVSRPLAVTCLQHVVADCRLRRSVHRQIEPDIVNG